MLEATSSQELEVRPILCYLMGRWESSLLRSDLVLHSAYMIKFQQIFFNCWCMLFQLAAAPGVNVGLWGDIYHYCNISDIEPGFGQPLLSRQTYSNLWFVVVFRLTPIINTIMLFNTNVGGEIELLNQEKSSCLTFWSWDLCFGLSSTFSLILSYW